MLLHVVTSAALVRGALQATDHDMLDASMFWAGLFMVLTPLVIIGSVVGFLWWQRRAPSRKLKR